MSDIETEVQNLVAEYVKPAEQDAMPYEVATSMLGGPRVKLSNRMRKNCHLARRVVYTSKGPIARPPKDSFVYAPHTVKTLETKVAAKMHAATWMQIHKWLGRTEKLRSRVQRAYLHLLNHPPDETNPAKVLFHARAKAALELRAAQLDVIITGALDERDNRSARCIQKPGPHIHPRHKRGNKNLCLAA